ncbi:hypothetical protein HanRHA438_Chr06g0281121 [Helianthus annuus]|nr:hypothetical protein HanRHA438_Chr06g0281121 [Helianthus annuus]
MRRNLSLLLRREMVNLDKDADSRKAALTALKSYVKDLDSNAIPVFLAQVSETKETGLTSGEYTISLYEVLARVHGTKIVPQIDNIMSTIIKTLTSGAASFSLQQACSKVVPAISTYAMDPTTPDSDRSVNRKLYEDQGDHTRSVTPSPQRSWSYINLDNIKIFTTPRKLMKSLQDSIQSQNVKSQASQSFISPLLSKFDLNCTSKRDQNGFLCDLSDSFTQVDERFYDASEHICQEVNPETKPTHWFTMRVLFGLVILFAIIVCFLLVGDANEEYYVVPT